MLRHRAALLATVWIVSLGSALGGGNPAWAQAPSPGEPAPAAPAPAAATAPTSAKPPVARHRRPALPALAPQPTGDVIQAIHVAGNQRIEEGTVLSYILVQPGDSFGSDRVDRSLRTLYATGLFADVRMSRDGGTLVVHVKENPLVNKITFEGNHNVKEEDLRKELQLRPRAVFTVQMAQSDRSKLLSLYAGKGRFAATVEPELVRLPQNRVNVIFKVVEGPQTQISRIVFVGNKAFDAGRLKEVIDSREERWFRFLSSSDQFNPERVNFDRELLRRFYLAHGFADFEVTHMTAELSPDRRSFFVTFQLTEGARYRVGKITARSEVPKVNAAPYLQYVTLSSGEYYNGDAVEKSGNAIQDHLRAQGMTFLDVNPRIARNPAKHTVDLVFDIVQGPKEYIERIDITGNSRTKDKVIRREFKFAEGDPYDPSLSRKTKTRLTDLGYFTDVKITPQPGSAADKEIINVNIDEKATGELSLGGGYSTDIGILGQAGLRERNLIGSGIDAGLNGTLGAYESQIDLSVTDPYFLDRNLVAGFDLYYLNNNNQYISEYEEKRFGGSARLGYAYNDHVSQAFSYTLVDRDVYNIYPTASVYVLDDGGWSLLSQIGQTLTFDYRDSRLDPHAGFLVRLGTDFAGLGGDENYIRAKVDGSSYIPLDAITGNSDWTVAISAGAGYLDNLQSKERIIDRFFLGGDNLRGFLDGGVGPHSVAYTNGCFVAVAPGQACPLGSQDYRGSDSLGGNFIWTQSTELRFPLPVSPDFGLGGRLFADVGGLSGLNVPPNARTSCQADLNGIDKATGKPFTHPFAQCFYNDSSPRAAVGFGISWKSPFGLINVDIGVPVVKKSYDQTQVLRFNFGRSF